MVNKIIIGIVICLILISVVMTIIYSKTEDKKTDEKPEFQGPVRPGDDESHFRETGITQPKEINN